MEIPEFEFFGKAIEAALAAGADIIRVYNSNFHAEKKDENSWITEADTASHRRIVDILAPTELPVISEESEPAPYHIRKTWSRYWLVDPLDGTREFIGRNGEFTVNIALMEYGCPVAGVIYVPARDELYAAYRQTYYRCKNTASINRETLPDLSPWESVPVNRTQKGVLRVIVSRSHLSAETTDFIKNQEKEFDKVEISSAGSSLKFCRIASGEADIYPRFGPTMEWDVAAGHAILKSAGKNVYRHPDGMELMYNKPDLTNDWFIAR